MTYPSAQDRPAAFSLTFLAPPVPDDTVADGPPPGQFSGPRRTGQPEAPAAAVNWLPRAQATASQMGITDEQVSLALAHPDEVQPDSRDPKCMVFRRGRLTVVTGREGRVIAVRRR